MRFRSALVVVALLGLLLPALADDTSNAPKRIAIFPLKTAAGIVQFWQGNFDPGQAMTDVLTDVLVKSNRYALFDRQNLDKIAQEQNLGVAGQVTPETAAQVGKLAGVQYIITGSVVEFSTTKKAGIGGISIPGIPIGIGAGGQRVRCTVEIHVTNVNTGQISAGIRGSAEEVVNSLAFGAFVPGAGVVGYGSEEFESSALGKAMVKCANDVAGQMDTVAFKDLPEAPALEGVIIDIDGQNITINVGNKQGVVQGMRFAVTRARQIIDPTNNQPRTLHEPVGQLQVIAVDDDTATCKASGTATFHVKDVVKQAQ
ncbi:MAG: CsgG/HfaB family protein [Candidatus Xenobia bacterium]